MRINDPIIDYLRATSKSQYLPVGIEATGERRQHFFGYDRAEGIAINMIPVGVLMQRAEGWLLQWSGKELELLRDRQMDELSILRILGDDWRIARIDFALDVFELDTERILADWLRRWRAGDCKTRATQTRHNDVCGRDGHIGTSVYLGGRSSEKMLRCYNKAIESGFTDEDWMRIEMEVKGKPAHAAPGVLGKIGLQATTRAYFSSFLAMTGIWDTIMKKLKYGVLEPLKRDRQPDDKFFSRVIMPYLEARIDTLPQKHIQWLKRFINLRREL